MMIAPRSLLMALAMAASGAVLAQPNEPPNAVPGNEAYYAEHPWERYGGPYDSRWYRQRADDYRARNFPGAGPARDLRIGDRLPRDWNNRQYAVENWRAHGLFRPPSGYQWYQAGGDYVLIESATGRIAQSRVVR